MDGQGILSGQMEENILGTIKMIKKMEKDYMSGQMEGNIKVHGKMESSMEKDIFFVPKKIFGKKVYGIMVKELNG